METSSRHPIFWFSFTSEFECPYLQDLQARYQVRLPDRRLCPEELDVLLAQGYRRQGSVLYRTACSSCRACEPLRIPVADFRPNRSQRRVWRRGQGVFQVQITEPQCDLEHVQLYDRHRFQRGLNLEPRPTTLEQYWEFLVDSCCETFEIQYRLDGRLAAVALTDRGRQGLSAVYCFFDPEFARYSPGTFSILTQLDLCRRWKIDYLYLGFYVARNRHMAYKARFRPHERLTPEGWKPHDPASCPLPPKENGRV